MNTHKGVNNSKYSSASTLPTYSLRQYLEGQTVLIISIYLITLWTSGLRQSLYPRIQRKLSCRDRKYFNAHTDSFPFTVRKSENWFSFNECWRFFLYLNSEIPLKCFQYVISLFFMHSIGVKFNLAQLTTIQFFLHNSFSFVTALNKMSRN